MLGWLLVRFLSKILIRGLKRFCLHVDPKPMRWVVMSLIFTWRKRANTGVALVLIGLAGLMQSILVLNAQITLEITSIYLLTIVPLGVSLALGGIEMVLAETIYRRFSTRERRPTRWRARERGSLRSLMGKLGIAALVSFFLIMAFFSASYLSVLGALSETGVPYFVRFVLAESASMIVAFVGELIVGRII
jgi:hypothetical protein